MKSYVANTSKVCVTHNHLSHEERVTRNHIKRGRKLIGKLTRTLFRTLGGISPSTRVELHTHDVHRFSGAIQPKTCFPKQSTKTHHFRRKRKRRENGTKTELDAAANSSDLSSFGAVDMKKGDEINRNYVTNGTITFKVTDN